jgi:hypothetical protein
MQSVKENQQKSASGVKLKKQTEYPEFCVRLGKSGSAEPH